MSEPRERPDAWTALRTPGVARFVVARTAAALGATMAVVAVGFHVYDRTGSVLALGFLGVVGLGPIALLLALGPLLDRHDRRSVCVAAASLAALVAGGLAVAVALDAPLGVLYALLFAQAAVLGALGPSSTVLFASIVPTGASVRANAWRSLGAQVAATAGPPLAGAMIAGFGGAGPVLATNAGLHALFAALVASIPRAPRGVPPVAVVGTWEGLRALRRSKPLFAAVLLDFGVVVFGAARALYPAFARDRLEVGALGLGWLGAAGPLGAALASAWMTRHPPTRRTGWTLLASVAGLGLATFGFGISREAAVALPLLAVAGACESVGMVVRSTLEQLAIPDALRGRAIAVRYVFLGASNELGAIECGAAAATWGLAPAIAGGGVVVVGLAVAAAALAPALRRLDRPSDLSAP